MTSIKIEFFDQTLKIPLLQGVAGSFWSKYLLRKKRALLILPEKSWESLYAVCKVLVILIRKRALVKIAQRASTSQ